MSERFKIVITASVAGINVIGFVVSQTVDFPQFLQMWGVSPETTTMRLVEWIPRIVSGLLFGLMIASIVYWGFPYFFMKLPAGVRLSLPIYRTDYLKSSLYPATELALQLLRDSQQTLTVYRGIPIPDPDKFSMYRAQVETVAQLLSDHGMPTDARFSRIREDEAGWTLSTSTEQVAWEWFLPLLVHNSKHGNLTGVRIAHKRFVQHYTGY